MELVFVLFALGAIFHAIEFLQLAPGKSWSALAWCSFLAGLAAYVYEAYGVFD